MAAVELLVELVDPGVLVLVHSGCDLVDLALKVLEPWKRKGKGSLLAGGINLQVSFNDMKLFNRSRIEFESKCISLKKVPGKEYESEKFIIFNA